MLLFVYSASRCLILAVLVIFTIYLFSYVQGSTCSTLIRRPLTRSFSESLPVSSEDSLQIGLKESESDSDPKSRDLDEDELDEDYTVSEGCDGTDSDCSDDPGSSMSTIINVLSSFEDHLKGPLGGKRKDKTINGWLVTFRRFLVKHQRKIQGKSISFIATMPVTRYVEGLAKLSAKVQFSEALKEFITMASIQDSEDTRLNLLTLKASRLKAKLMLKTTRKMKHQETRMKSKTVEELESEGQWIDFRKLKEMTCENDAVVQDWLEYVEESKINWKYMSPRIKSRGLDTLIGSIFLRSKAIRPESLMVLHKSAWTDSHVSGLINVLHSQTFKTEGVYGYTTLVFDKTMSSMMNQYLSVVRPLIVESTGSNSSNFFLNAGGKPFKQLTYELVRFTKRYAGVTITPTRLRMIYETFIDEHGSQEQKTAVALSLAHSPTIVKKHYLKRRADEAALKDFQTYSLTKLNNNMTTVTEPGPQTPVKDVTLINDVHQILKDSSTVTSTPSNGIVPCPGGSPGPGLAPLLITAVTPTVTTVLTSGPAVSVQPVVLTDTVRLSVPGSESGAPSPAQPLSQTQPDPFAASTAPPFSKVIPYPTLRGGAIKARPQCHPDSESRSHSSMKKQILKPLVSLKRQNSVSFPAPESDVVHDERVTSAVPATQSIFSGSHFDSQGPVPQSPTNPRPGPSPGDRPIVSSQTVVAPVTPVVSESAHKTKNKTSGDSVCGGRWGDSAWQWNDQSDSYILEKVRQEGNLFKKIHSDGIRDNVWTESCTANKIKSRFHSQLRKKINSEGLQ